MSITYEDKITLRKHMLQKRSLLDEHIAERAAEHIASAFMQHIPLCSEDVVALYYPIRNEVNTAPLRDRLYRQKIACALPVVTAKDAPLLFRQYTTETPLIASNIPHIYEPSHAAPIMIPTVIVTPLVAFDNAAIRLGYGGGYYDRTFAGYNRATLRIIAVAYALQETPSIPCEPHDQRLDAVVTEKEVRWFG